MATTNYTTELQKLYVAYFNRPADPAGLAFWNGVVAANGGNTAIVSADFASQAEYKTAYAGMNNTQIINQVYQNLFSHGPDTAGREYWVKALDNKVFTIDQIVAEVANGALSTDKVSFNNKVAAATAFTAAVDTAAEMSSYTGVAANAAAKAFITGITTDATLANALTPANLDASVAAVVKAGTPFTLASGLADLDAAKAAIPAFFKSLNDLDLDKDGDATTAPDAADITAEVSAAQTKVGTSVTAAGFSYAGTDAAKAASLTDTQLKFNADLTAAQKAYTDAVTAAGKVAGLNAAISSATAADANLATLVKVEAGAKAAQAAAEASYESLNNNVNIVINASTGATAVGATNILVVNASGNLVLATDITEADNPGVTALLSAVKAELVASQAVTAATSAQTAAHLDVSIRDTAAGETAELADIGAKFFVSKPVNAAAPTAAEIQTEILGLKGAVAAGVSGAAAAQTAFNSAISAFNTANTDPLSGAVKAGTTAVTDATKAITDFDKAVTALTAANAHDTTIKGLTAAVTAAQDAFAAHDFVKPVDAVGVVAATAGADIFLVGATSGTIANFNLQGKDVLYVGADHTLNAGKPAAGSASVLEVFLVQNGTSTDVHVETKTFGSVSGDEVVITLNGVQTTDLTFSNGIISHV